MSTSSTISAPAIRPSDDADERQAAPRPRRAARPEERQAISVIVPVRNDPALLDQCLRALAASEHPDFEIIVVDDASTDSTLEVAQRHDVRVITAPDHAGPAAARNRGAWAARHGYLFFVDADVRVEPGTLARVAEKFRSSPEVDAFFGSYDTRPGAPGVVSQYRNLLHHFVHQAGKQRAFSFWSGCGAIKRSVFLELGGFDTGYSSASIEDIELGARLRRAGHRVELVKSLQVKHMKRWTLWNMVRTDVRNRGIPWTLLLLRQRKIPNDLNLRYSQRWSAAAAAALLLTLALGTWRHPALPILPALTYLALAVAERWTSRLPGSWARTTTSATILGAAVAAGVLTPLGDALIHPWALGTLGFLLAIVLLNLRFYLFLARVKYPSFVLLVLPLHVAYYLYSSFAFVAGLILHLRRRAARAAPP